MKSVRGQSPIRAEARNQMHNPFLDVCLCLPQLPVAVKSLRGSGSKQTEMLKDFLQEVTVMQSLDHPNIIQLYGVVLTQPLKMVRSFNMETQFFFLE